MSKNIKKLKYPLWFNIVFYALTLLVPTVGVAIQGFKSASPTFRLTFGLFVGLIILWIFVKIFIINKLEKRINDRKLQLEHDYEIESGNGDKIESIWLDNELILAIFNALEVVLIGGLIILLAIGVEKAMLKIEGLCYLIALCYIVAYVLKFSYILFVRNKKQKETTDGEQKF